MSKMTTRRKTARPALSRRRQRELGERRELERSVRLQRTVRRLCRQLEKEITRADDALRAVGRIAVERDMPTASSLRDPHEDQEPATAGAAAGDED